MIGLTADLVTLVQSGREITQAVSVYKSTVDKAKAAAQDLGSKWEGDARDAFMAEQEKAYNWHMNIADIAWAFGEALEHAAEQYESAESFVASLIRLFTPIG